MLASHTRASPSSPTDTTSDESRLNAAEYTIPVWPANWHTAAAVSVSYTRARLSYPTVTTRDPSPLNAAFRAESSFGKARTTSPVSPLHRYTCPPSSAVNSQSFVGWKRTDHSREVCLSNVRSTRPVATSQTRTTLSQPAVATRLPSGAYATAATTPACPSYFADSNSVRRRRYAHSQWRKRGSVPARVTRA